MGKKKGQQNEQPKEAFFRMNYLYQASNLLANTSQPNQLSGYYGRQVREISKKVVEKLHPELKRSLCIACSNPLVPGHVDVKVKSMKASKKQRQNKKKNIEKESGKNEKLNSSFKKEVKNKRPNKMVWTCRNCGFSKSFVQRPNYNLWIDNKEAIFKK